MNCQPDDFAIYFRYAFDAQKLYQRQALVMAFSSIIPWIGSFGIVIFDYDLVPLLDE